MIKSIINNLPPTDSLEKNAARRLGFPGGDSGGFSHLFSEYLSEIKSLQNSASGADDLNSDQLALLVRKIQMQVNQRLLEAVLDDQGSSKHTPSITKYEIMLDNLRKAGELPAGASKNSQATPKIVDHYDRAALEPIIEKAAGKYDVDPHLIRSVIRAESNFDSKATSVKGAMGLMQLMPQTAKDMGVENAYDAKENIMGGTRYLKMLLDRYKGDIELALAAYNWGMGNLERKPDSLPAETVTYISRVKSYYKSLKA